MQPVVYRPVSASWAAAAWSSGHVAPIFTLIAPERIMAGLWKIRSRPVNCGQQEVTL